MQRLGLPASLWWFVFTAVVFALQAFPFTRIFLMFAMAPFWSALTINFGFLSLAIEALNGRANRFWLAAPIAWFGGYAALTTFSHFEAYRTGARTNGLIVFDPSKQSVVLDTLPNFFFDLPQRLVASYQLDVAYARLSNGQFYAHRVGNKATCRSIRTDPKFHAGGYYVEDTDNLIYESILDMCTYAAPADPKLDPIAISVKTYKGSANLSGETTYQIKIESSGGRQILESGSGAPLTWFPAPVLGCTLIDSRSTWNCFAFFLRETTQQENRNAKARELADSIAHALALKSSVATERREILDKAGPLPPPSESR